MVTTCTLKVLAAIIIGFLRLLCKTVCSLGPFIVRALVSFLVLDAARNRYDEISAKYVVPICSTPVTCSPLANQRSFLGVRGQVISTITAELIFYVQHLFIVFFKNCFGFELTTRIPIGNSNTRNFDIAFNATNEFMTSFGLHCAIRCMLLLLQTNNTKRNFTLYKCIARLQRCPPAEAHVREELTDASSLKQSLTVEFLFPQKSWTPPHL